MLNIFSDSIPCRAIQDYFTKLKKSAREKKLIAQEEISSPPTSPSSRSPVMHALPFVRPQAAIRKNPSTSTLETSLMHSASRLQQHHHSSSAAGK